jgi:hypothetical protein
MLNEAAIAPTDVKVDQLQRKYAIRVLTLPHNHPVRKRCPSSFTPYNESEENDEEDIGGTSWDVPPRAKSAFQSRLTRVLSTLRDWILPANEIETYSTTACAPWEESQIAITISPDNKEEAAEAHKKQHTLLTNVQNRSHNLIACSDSSMLSDTVGARVYIEGGGSPPTELTIPLGLQMEVYDAESIGIMKAAETSLKIATQG